MFFSHITSGHWVRKKVNLYRLYRAQSYDLHFPSPRSLRTLIVKITPTMSLTLRCPPENTIAFGGVATGNMKANEQEIAAGSMRYQGWTWSSFAWKQTKDNGRLRLNNDNKLYLGVTEFCIKVQMNKLKK